MIYTGYCGKEVGAVWYVFKYIPCLSLHIHSNLVVRASSYSVIFLPFLSTQCIILYCYLSMRHPYSLILLTMLSGPPGTLLGC